MQVRQGAQLERYLIQQEQKPNFTIRREVPLQWAYSQDFSRTYFGSRQASFESYFFFQPILQAQLHCVQPTKLKIHGALHNYMLFPAPVKLLTEFDTVTHLMCQIMIRMIYAKEMFNVLTDRFIRIWGNISHENLQKDLRVNISNRRP